MRSLQRVKSNFKNEFNCGRTEDKLCVLEKPSRSVLHVKAFAWLMDQFGGT